MGVLLVLDICVPWIRVYLAELFLMNGNRLAMLVKDQESRTRSPLVDTSDEHLVRTRHGGLL